MYILGYPLGLIMRLLYNVLHSYGWALLLFTVLVKLAMVPLSIKQQKSSAKMAAIQPQLQEIQKMYAKNQQKMNEELQKLYQREKYNPAGGCLPMLITFLVLFGLIDVIYKPMTHVLGMSSELIAQAQSIMEGLGVAFSHYSPQTSIITSVQENPQAYAALGQELVSKIQAFDLNFLGINLGATPSFALNVLVLIPILSGVTAFLSSWITMRNNPTAMEGPGAGTMKTMMLISPLMSLWIAFQVPAGVGIYWIVSNLLMAVQSLILNKFYNPREMAEKVKQEAEARREQERAERIEAKKKAREGDAEAKAKAKTQKEINRQKLAEARKRDAEKYGDVYTEVTDDDLE